MTSQDLILSEIDDFLNEDLAHRGAVECVILCGSYATGKAAERSDVDLCYIGQFDDFSRERRLMYRGREYELMIAPWSWCEHVVSEYERKGNIGTITAMLATGVCLRGDSETWRKLQQFARQHYDAGPSRPTDIEIRKIKAGISDLWDDYCDASDTLVRRWISVEIVRECVNAQFILRGWWAVKTKYQLEELTNRDKNMAELVHLCLDSSGYNDEAME
ncbi:MAG: nucleotidyltransferase domain-containing protein, partial [Coriobacteriia bacterium]